jgi:para-aminobenzoate synthetase/4-amino-4-deoxychorismate lyase
MLIQENEVLLKHGNAWLHFKHPHQVLAARRVNEVRDRLREVENLVNSKGWHAAGFVSYEAAPAFDSAFQVHATDDFPLLWFGLYDQSEVIELPGPARMNPGLSWKPAVSRQRYEAAVEKIRDHISHGRTYQVNHTMRLRSDFDGDAWELFLLLAGTQNTYAALIDTGRYAICSASPELFFELHGEGIRSQPMKGTIARGRTTREDDHQAGWLKHSEKNRAENVMIVDLIRNDIGRVAEVGSVHVPQLFSIEKYPTLFQMTSTVEAQTRSSVSDIFDALFPCGSITGAPKVSTMKIISELETTPRRIYTGSIGLISPNRNARFNVAIRTVLVDREKRTAEYGTGGGVVWDSTSADEYDEALLKARVLTEPWVDFSLFETLLWEPSDGYFLPARHIARMEDSARYFDFRFSSRELKALLEKLAGGFKGRQRIKIQLDRAGHFSAETSAFTPESRVWKAGLAKHPVDSNNVFLFHKTTQRTVYEKALKDRKKYDDVLLYNEREELTEFTIGNLVVELDGRLVTPSITSGLLAGTFRAHLLEAGEITERVIHKNELRHCKKIFLINALRKWVEVQI